jgi:hypothetical protein
MDDAVRSVPDVLGGQRVRAVARPRRTVDCAAEVHSCAKASDVRPVCAYARRRDAHAHRAGIVTHEWNATHCRSRRGGGRSPPR